MLILPHFYCFCCCFDQKPEKISFFTCFFVDLVKKKCSQLLKKLHKLLDTSVHPGRRSKIFFKNFRESDMTFSIGFLLAIKGLDFRSVLEFWVLGIGQKFRLSVFLADWVLKITVNCSIPNTQYPTLIFFCLSGYWKNYGIANIQYPTLNTQYPISNTQYFLPDWVLKNYGMPNIQYPTLNTQ